MGTFFANAETMTRKWYVIDGAGKPLGRVAVEAAKILRGKNKPTFTPHVDCGDHVIVVNADKCLLTGTNKKDELIQWHSGYPGGLKSVTRGKVMAQTPTRLLMRAVKGMLPHNKLGDATLKKFRVYAGPDHEQEAQKPEPFEF